MTSWLLLLGDLIVATAAVLATPWLAKVSIRRRPWAIGLLASLAALVGLFATSAPTGLLPWDRILEGAFAAGATWAGSRSRRWARLSAASLATLGSAGSAGSLFAFAALGLAIGATRLDKRSSLTGALTGALAAQAFLRLAWPQRGLTTAMFALAGLAVLVGSALRQSRSKQRKRILEAVGALGIVGVGFGALGALAAVQARPADERGLAAARAALAASKSGDTAAATSAINHAADLFGQAQTDLSPWWAAPARLVPVVGPNFRAIADMSGWAATVSSDLANLSVTRQSSSTAGRQSVIARLASMAHPIAQLATDLRSAQGSVDGLQSPWLLPPIADRVRMVRSKLDPLGTHADAVAKAATALPSLLGANGPRRYLLVVQDPVEARGAGGVIGDVGVITADHGHLTLSHLTAVTGLNPPGVRVSGPGVKLALSQGMDLRTSPQDATFSPDFPTDARLMEQIYPQLGTGAVNGVISLDPQALASLLKLTGPIKLSEWPVPLTSANAVPILLNQQYLVLHGDARVSFLLHAARTIFDHFLSRSSPSPLAATTAITTPMRDGHLLVYLNQPSVEHALRSLGVSGALPPVKQDFLQVVTQDASSNKIDWYLRRSITYRVHYNPATGQETARLGITLTNHAPSAGLPPYLIGGQYGGAPPGTSQLLVSVYSPLGYIGGTGMGQPLLMSSQYYRGRHLYSQLVSIPPGGTVHWNIDLAGSIKPGNSYRLRLGEQPLVWPDHFAASVSVPAGFTAPAGAPKSQSVAQFVASTIRSMVLATSFQADK